MVTVEQLLDKIADKLIASPAVTPDILLKNQKTIRNGVMQIGRGNAEKLILFEKDVRANEEDLISSAVFNSSTSLSLQAIADSLVNHTIDQVNIEVTLTSDIPPQVSQIVLEAGGWIYDYLDIAPALTSVTQNEDGTETVINPLNVSQFISIENLDVSISSELATEYLDTTIYELIPGVSERQQRIDAWFAEFQTLTNNPPDFQIEENRVGENFSSNEYHWTNDITAPQENDEQTELNEQEGMITRLDFDDNTENSGKTLESIRDTLNTYLVDIDEEPLTAEDMRPTYQNKSEGYLRFRQLNQGIIIRNVNQSFVEGLNPDEQEYLQTGFTLTMWTRFIDKTSEGTLFNFGSPLREENALGFMLDTYIIKKNRENDITKGIPVSGWTNATGSANPNGELFQDTDNERFVRLLVNEGGKLRDSHVGQQHLTRGGGLDDDSDATTPKISLQGIPMQGFDNYNYATGQEDYDLAPNQTNVTTGDGQFVNSLGLLNHTKIPYKPSEWYFICATYNPNIAEDNSYDLSGCPYWATDCNKDPNFWRGNYDPDLSSYIHHSGKGAKCKVEIISRTDLLRARGYKV